MNGHTDSAYRFEDLSPHLPGPGTYPCSIDRARFRRSSNGNAMLEVLFYLETVHSLHRLVFDYFVLSGPRVSHGGIQRSRERLLALYHACGLSPMEGEQIVPEQLLDAQLEIRLTHEVWQGRTVLHVTDYLPLSPPESHSPEEPE